MPLRKANDRFPPSSAGGRCLQSRLKNRCDRDDYFNDYCHRYVFFLSSERAVVPLHNAAYFTTKYLRQRLPCLVRSQDFSDFINTEKAPARRNFLIDRTEPHSLLIFSIRASSLHDTRRCRISIFHRIYAYHVARSVLYLARAVPSANDFERITVFAISAAYKVPLRGTYTPPPHLSLSLS